MTVQSSFLIRCHLNPVEPDHPARSYHIQHIQSGAEFRCGAIAEVNQWIAEQNLSYLHQVLATPAAPAEDDEPSGGVL